MFKGRIHTLGWIFAAFVALALVEYWVGLLSPLEHRLSDLLVRIHARHVVADPDIVIVDIDDRTYRHAWSARGEPLTHHNASLQVFSDGPEKCRVVWIADLLPNEVAATVDEMTQHGLSAMKKTLETSPTSR